MRYRMETLGNQIVVRNVDTDLIAGWVTLYYEGDPHDPNRRVFAGCRVVDECLNDMVNGFEHDLPPRGVAYCEEEAGFPHLKPLDRPPERNRFERALGTMVADFVCALLNMVSEEVNGGATYMTKKACRDLLEDLLDIWDVSRDGSWNDERRAYEAYFADPKPENPRLNFGGAVRAYGLVELRKRFPQESDATLEKLLWWPIEMMDRVLRATGPAPSPELQRLAASVLNAIRGPAQGMAA
jgi:hypothetical protein